MNTETGQIIELKEFHDLTEKEQEPYIPILNKDMTKKTSKNKTS